MRKIVIHEVNVHIGGPPPAAGGSGKPKRRKARSRREDRTIDDEFERVSDRTASHVEAGQDDLVPDYGLPAATLGSIVAIPTSQSLEDTNDHDGDWDDVEDDLGHGTGNVDEHGDVPGGADEFSPGLSGDIAVPLDDALAYEDAPTAEELEAAFRDWKEPEFCGLTSFWWRAFGSLMACAATGTVLEGEWVGKAVRYLAGAGEPFGKPRTADRGAGEPDSFSLAALAVFGCDEACDLDALLMEASGVFNSAVIADHASRLRGKPEVATRFLAAYREALRHDARLMQAAAAWKSVQDRVDEIHTRQREFRAAGGLAWTQVVPGAEADFRAPGEGWDEDSAFLSAFYALGYASRTLARGAFLAAGPAGGSSPAGEVDPSSSAG